MALLDDSQDPLAWQSETDYVNGDKIKQEASDGGDKKDYIFEVITAGTSGETKPNFSNITKTYVQGDTLDDTNRVLDNTVIWAALKIFDPATDSAYFWESVGIALPTDIDNLLTTITDTVGMVLPILDVYLTFAELVKLFLKGFANPLFAALVFLLDQIIEYVENLKKGGFHMISVTPADGIGTFIPFTDFGRKIDSIEADHHILNSPDANQPQTIDFHKSYKEKKGKIIAKIKKQEGKDGKALSSKIEEWSKGIMQKNGNDNPGWYVLKTSETIRHFVKSFDDIADQSKPPTSTGVYAGGVVIFFGFKGNVRTIINTVAKVYQFLALLSNSYKQFADGANEIQKTLANIIDIFVDDEITLDTPINANGTYVYKKKLGKTATLKIKVIPVSDTGDHVAGVPFPLVSGKTHDFWLNDIDKQTIHFPLKDFKYTLIKGDKLIIEEAYQESTKPKQKLTAPDWKTYRTFEIIPGADDLFDSVLNFLKGMKANFEAAGGEIEKLIKFIDKKIKTIKDLVSQVEKIITEINSIKGGLDLLKEGESLKILMVEPQVGGIKKIKELVQDPTVTGAPRRDLDYTGLVSFIGSGPGMGILMNLFGMAQGKSYPIELDLPSDYATLTDSEKMKKKAGLLTPEELADFEKKAKNRVKDRVAYLEENTSFSMSPEAKSALVPDYDDRSDAEKFGS